jgi:hypothetical protein
MFQANHMPHPSKRRANPKNSVKSGFQGEGRRLWNPISVASIPQNLRLLRHRRPNPDLFADFPACQSFNRERSALILGTPLLSRAENESPARVVE